MTADDVAAPAGPGPSLKVAREEIGIRVLELARSLKVEERVVVAIDEERYEELPPRAYSRGYVRRYADLVGLDADEMSARFDAVCQERPLTRPVVSGRRAPPLADFFRRRAGLLYGSLVSLFIAVIASAVVWITWQSSNDATAPESPVPWDHGVNESNAPGADSAPAEASEESSADSLAPAAAADGSSDTGPTVAPQVDELRFVFGETSWVEVRDGDGDLIHADLERAGASLTVSGQAPFTIVLGYAPGVRLTYNSDPVALGPHTRDRQAELVVGR